MQEPQNDLSARVARVKHRAHPWRSIIALVLAIAAAVISGQAGSPSSTFPTTNHVTNEIVRYATAALFGIFGSLATYGLAGQVREVLEPRMGTSHAAVVGYAVLILGAFTTLVITLNLFGVPVRQLVIGGALTSVFVGIAAQQALGNVFAGMVLLLAHPFRVGDAIILRSGALGGGPLEGTVTEIGITYVRLDTGASVMSVPNSQVLNAVVGPLPPSPAAEPPAEASHDPAEPAGAVGPPGHAGRPG